MTPTSPARPTIALLCLGCDPTVLTPGVPLAIQRRRVRSIAIALAQLGWQVEIFTPQRPSNRTTTTWIAPFCRMVCLPLEHRSGAATASTETIPALAHAIQSFQAQEGSLWPLFHSFDEYSAQVGNYFKQQNGWRWIHTDGGQGSQPWHPPLSALADQRVLLQPEAAQTNSAWAAAGSPQPPQRHFTAQGLDNPSWEQVAIHLSWLYRQQLALYIGAVGLETAQVHKLLIPLSAGEIPGVPILRVSPPSSRLPLPTPINVKIAIKERLTDDTAFPIR